MSTTQSTSTSESSTDTSDYDLTEIGIEFEYPVARGDQLTSRAHRSGSLRDEYGRNNNWLNSEFGSEGGYMGTDHVGAEITSGVLDLHSDEPERWYNASIEAAEEMGYPFAATGTGQTSFGLHNHLSTITDEVREIVIDEVTTEPWGHVFFCSSVMPDNVHPWRGRYTSPTGPWSGPYTIGSDGHWEFRFIEPMLPEHFTLVMDFWRKMDTHSPEAAVDYARELVYNKDKRLTCVQRYEAIKEEQDDNWPHPEAITDPGRGIEGVSEWFVDLMEG